ncbi:ABC multidrug transporter atrD [Cladobotryum mycophilum]|uniref:ABC multidrug transporter atrD n=1 Tax=Cladobotryum mycophilum TaxID=491253 RepID=A0ABR0T4A2_9HYPO
MASPYAHRGSVSALSADPFQDGASNDGSTFVDDTGASSSVIELKTIEREPVNEPAPGSKYKPPKSKKADKSVEEDPEEPFRQLPPHEADILKRQVLTPKIDHGIGVLYRYASRGDILIILLSTVCAIASGAALPLMTLVFGGLQEIFSKYTVGLITKSELSGQLGHYVLYFVYLALGQFAVTYVATVGFIYTGENISAKIRQHYLESCMKQNIGFFDKIGAGEIVTRITADTNLIQDGISEKVALTLTSISSLITSFVIAFANHWKLSLILSSVLLGIVLNGGLFSGYMMKNSKLSLESQAASGTLADEVLGSIRSAVAFGTQERLIRQYDKHLAKTEFYGFRSKASIGIMIGGMMMLLYLSYALAFWQGAVFLLRGDISLKHVLIVMMNIIMGSFSVGNISPNFQAFNSAIGAAAKIFDTIDRVSPIDPSLRGGDMIEDLQGHIELENIKHIYPSRPGVVVMNGVSLNIPAGKTTALVGASGSGKSTIVGLLERFYNPVEGTVYLDGRDITTLNLRWLRSQMALVGQEPTLFRTSIFNNIRHGLVGSRYEYAGEEYQRDLIMTAAKKANAHDFISDLPEGYDTSVGDRGFLLSGGQKQRIAIARAIVSDPKILLLDEATSALDTKSEGIVQQALEAASRGRTTITIAHRLSTIKDAHNIVVMSAGRIVEQGTHAELLENKSMYYDLVSSQSFKSGNELTEEEQDAIDEQQNRLIIRKSLALLGKTTVQEVDDDHILEKTQVSTAADILAIQKHTQEDRTKYSIWELILFIASFNRTEWKRMLVGLFFSVVCGLGNPFSAIMFAKELFVLTSALIPNADLEEVRSKAYFWATMFIVLAMVQLVGYSGQGVTFASCSEHLVHRLRYHAFRSMLRQDISFFDKEENTAGALTAFLSTETNHIAGLSGANLGTILLTLSTLTSSIIVSLIVGWKLALVCTATVPVLLGCGFFRFHLLSHFQNRAKAAYTASAAYASEALSAIRTVASLTREREILDQYKASVAEQQRKSFISVLQSSAVYGASQGAGFLVFGLAFWYGGMLLATGEYNMYQFFVCFMAIVNGSNAAGTIFSLAPDMGKAHSAATELKKLSDRKPAIDTWSNGGERLGKSHIQGTVEFRDVHFRYPTRLEQPILRGLNLSVTPGQYVALVGASGCGKSTTISLLERFYDPISGGIYVDGKDISTLNINEYRSVIALVSQEPTLYQGTIRENILLGTSEGEVTEDELEHACKEANIYDFIISLPDGFNTIVGSKGGLLSGGQKQRIAIARALIRNPKILLLDEATSALDTESEHIVQAALDKAAKGRTTIAVAHRLSTIQKADIIYVFDQGRVVESGSHSELMRKNGRYAELVKLQTLNHE